MPRFLKDPTELAFIDITSVQSLVVDSASADLMKLDMLWTGPLTDIPCLPLTVAALTVFDELGWSVFLDFFFLLRMSGSNSVVQFYSKNYKKMMLTLSIALVCM